MKIYHKKSTGNFTLIVHQNVWDQLEKENEMNRYLNSGSVGWSFASGLCRD